MKKPKSSGNLPPKRRPAKDAPTEKGPKAKKKSTFEPKPKRAPREFTGKKGPGKPPTGAPKRAEARPVPPPPPPPPAPEPTPVEIVPFDGLGLSEKVLEALRGLGFETATPIQAMAIPAILTGRDIIGLAQTGTGKTAAFGLPLIDRIDPQDPSTQGLILAPTRELAVQVAKGIYDFGKTSGVKVVPVYGGQPIDRQFRALRGGAQIVVGTPGRVLDHLRRGSLRLDGVKLCVLDEADEMMALGFTEDMEAILSELPESRQLAFFSATMAPRVLSITEKFLRDPERVEVVAKQRTLETTNQTYYEVPAGKKEEALARVLDMETPGSTIVFCRTRQETADLSELLRLRGYNAEPIHGDMNQTERERVLKRFREGHADLLVATDVAARGLDIDSVTHVINYDVPWDVEQYIHRIGRTGRAGRSGDAITLIYHKERRKLENIERQIGSKIQPARIPTVADIAMRRQRAFVDSVREALDGANFELMLNSVNELAEDYDATQIAAAALHLLWQERHKVDAPVDAEEEFAGYEQPEAGMARIFVGMGRSEGLRPGDLVGAITNESGLNGKQIGVIELLDRMAFVEVPANEAERVVAALSNTKIRNRKVKIDVARPAFGDGTPERPAPRRRYER